MVVGEVMVVPQKELSRRLDEHSHKQLLESAVEIEDRARLCSLTLSQW